MKKTLGGKYFNGSPASVDEIQKIISKKGAESILIDFTKRYSLIVANAHLNLLYIHAQDDNCRKLAPKEEAEMHEFCLSINELLLAVYDFCGQEKAGE